MKNSSLVDHLSKEIKDVWAILDILASQFDRNDVTKPNIGKSISRFVFDKLNNYDFYSYKHAYMEWTEQNYPNGKENIDWNKIKFIKLAPVKNGHISDPGFRKSVRKMQRIGLIKKETVNDCVSLNRSLLSKLEMLFADEYFDAITKNEKSRGTIKKTAPKQLTPEEKERKERTLAEGVKVKAIFAKVERKPHVI